MSFIIVEVGRQLEAVGFVMGAPSTVEWSERPVTATPPTTWRTLLKSQGNLAALLVYCTAS